MFLQSYFGLQIAGSHHDPVDDVYLHIEPLENFSWKTTEPLQLRPFKPVYHLTMGTHAIIEDSRSV